MEDNNNYKYTYRREKQRQQQRMRLIMLIGFGVLFLLCILFGVLFGNRAAAKAYQKEHVKPAEISEPVTEQPVTKDPEVDERLGEYTVNTGGSTLMLRENSSRESRRLAAIGDGTKLTVTEIYHNPSAAAGSDTEYWAKTTYNGMEGWVALKYLKKVTPAPTAEDNTEDEPIPFETGAYVISTDGKKLALRKTPSGTGELLLKIPDGTALTVTEFKTDASAEGDQRYWGLVTYQDISGYVCMAFLKKAD